MQRKCRSEKCYSENFACLALLAGLSPLGLLGQHHAALVASRGVAGSQWEKREERGHGLGDNGHRGRGRIVAQPKKGRLRRTGFLGRRGFDLSFGLGQDQASTSGYGHTYILTSISRYEKCSLGSRINGQRDGIKLSGALSVAKEAMSEEPHLRGLYRGVTAQLGRHALYSGLRVNLYEAAR